VKKISKKFELFCSYFLQQDTFFAQIARTIYCLATDFIDTHGRAIA
jgi:hypothetical protein